VALKHKEIGPILAAQHTKIDLPTITTITTTTTHNKIESTDTSNLPDTHYTSHTNESDNDTDSDMNIDTNDIMDPINTNTLTITTITTTKTTTTTTTTTIEQHKEVLFPTLESILSEFTDLPPVHKIIKKRKIINNDNIDSGEENEERRKSKEKTKGREKMGHREREVIILDNQMDEEVKKTELDNMDDIDVEKELVTINENPNKLPEFNCMCTFSFNVNCYNF
jgi:hypothetical protein